MEHNLVEIWLRRDPIRWIAGALAGLFAGAVALIVAMWMSSAAGMETWFPAKLVAMILRGPSATEYGYNQDVIISGVALFEAFCLFFGVIFAHFTGTNSLKALLPMGLTWGIFSWIFIWNLFMPSFKPILAAAIPAGPVMPVCLAYGLSLASVSLFDRVFRPTRK